MNRLMNRCVRYFIRKFDRTGLEQELNKFRMDGELAVPEIAQIARKAAADGIVLLKNESQTLPIRRTDTVAVFGRCAIDYFTVGYGSGGDVVAPYRSNLMDGLEERGVRVCRSLYDAYRIWCASPKNVPDEGFWGHWPMSYPEMPLTEEQVENAAAESDLALVVIGRAAGESRENVLKKGSYYLTDRELNMLRMVTNVFDRVAVIMDCGNVIDMGWTEEFGDRIGAIVYAWQGGMESGYALADVLTGTVNPSARLTDTIARRYENYPTCGSFGRNRFNEYREDIYVGYRYFETFAPDDVLYPFGFGLSYTSFRQKSECTFDGLTATVTTTVTNIGDCAGREVVQLYICKPCGRLGNPTRELASFRKTDCLAPGESTVISQEINVADIASFDDSGTTGCENCYILESGVYEVYAGTNVRDAKPVNRIEITDQIVLRQLSERGAVRPEHRFQRIADRGGKLAFEPVPVSKKSLRDEILNHLPTELRRDTCENYVFSDVLQGNCSPEAFVAQLTDQELDDISHGAGKMNYPGGPLGNAGAFGGVTDQLRERGLPAVITTDGPSGIRLKNTCSLLPCGTALASTFDTDLVYQLYSLVGREMLLRGSDMLLAPGMNIHRDPLCGRNFEYFSEDPYLTGKIAASVIRGIQSNGVSACPKHYACNNQETNRNRNDSRVSQRALREIYLRGFEIAVREAKPMAIMTSYNLINGVWGHYHYDLVNGILRSEWGFDGLVITDWWMQPGESEEFPNISNDAFRIRSGVDVLMPGQFKDRTIQPSIHDPNGITRAEAQNTALHVIRFIKRLKDNPSS